MFSSGCYIEMPSGFVLRASILLSMNPDNNKEGHGLNRRLLDDKVPTTYYSYSHICDDIRCDNMFRLVIIISCSLLWGRRAVGFVGHRPFTMLQAH